MLRVAVRGVLGLSLLGSVVAGAAYWDQVVRQPGEHISEAYILGVIANETPVTYRDGVTRLGVFFSDEHRTFVSYEELPTAYVASIVAAEDGAFWSHPGFSIKHIVRAMVQNLKAGRLVAGGSTLTQQTAKNLYYRPDRSLKSKLEEAVNALRLEHHFEKRQILEFYANQFHVYGNGRGLGIAARHFFNKEVSELTVLESAFLAGLVKSPSAYDPFIGDSARQARATERAHDRTRYVLQRLLDEEVSNLVPPTEGLSAEQAMAQRQQVLDIRDEAARLLNDGFSLEFKRGEFRFESSVLVDEVARRLGEPPFDRVLENAGIDDPSKAGLTVVTTLDAEVQRGAVYALWHHLTEVGLLLEAPGLNALVREGRGPRYAPRRRLQEHGFYLATVVGPVEVEGKTWLNIDIGGQEAVVDRDGLVRIAVHLARGEAKSNARKVSTQEVDAVANDLPAGATVWVSVREQGPDRLVCDLEWRPTLQGAVSVLREGQVLAMVGGNDNRNFNRVDAPRQMGSTWKPVVYQAAMTLGWDPDDLLDNRRSVFGYSTTHYYPRPDHTPQPEVSMSWAGVKSENVASIWLLYHLVDKLGESQLLALAKELDLLQREGEVEEDYARRMQEAGVLATSGRRREARYLRARAEILGTPAGLEFPGDELGVQSLVYGWGFGAERARVGVDAEKQRALDWSWTTVRQTAERCRAQVGLLEEGLGWGEIPSGLSLLSMVPLEPGQTTLQLACGEVPEGYVPVGPDVLPVGGGLEGLNRAERRSMRRDGGAWRIDLPTIQLDGRLHLGTVDALQSAIQRQELSEELSGGVELYSPQNLIYHQDFRVLVALRYVVRMARQLGVQTALEEVLSLPLGASEITLEEAALLYQGLTTGRYWSFPGKGPDGAAFEAPSAPTLLIARILDVEGRVLYEATPESERIQPVDVAAMTTDILANVVQYGTGRRAKKLVKLGTADLPVYGKTGTTNSFRNAAFSGGAPVLASEGIRYGRALTVSAYVGYDDNRKMTNGRISIAGASGALPVWMDTLRAAHGADVLGEPTTALPPDGASWPWPSVDGLERRPMSPMGEFLDATGGVPVVDELLSAGSVLTRVPQPPVVVPTHTERDLRVAPRIRMPGMGRGGRRDGGVWDVFERRRNKKKGPPSE